MSKIITVDSPIRKDPPTKQQRVSSGSKYDKLILYAINNPDEWYLIAKSCTDNRDSLYSTASAIRSGRLGNIPSGRVVELKTRRVMNEIHLYIKGIS